MGRRRTEVQPEHPRITAADQPPGAPTLPAGHGVVLGMVSGGAPVGEVLTALARLVEEQEVAARCAILARDGQGDCRVAAAPSLSSAWQETVTRQAAASPSACGETDPVWLCHPTVLQLVEGRPDEEDANTGDLHVCSTMPIFVDGAAVGVLAVYYEAPHIPDASETMRLGGYAQIAAVALSRAKTEAQLQLRLNLDATTGLPTANDVTARLEVALGRSRQVPGAIVAVITIDLPRLPEYNTTFGFSAGDDVLRFVATALHETAGASGTVLRSGGGRFLLIVEGMTRPEDVVDLAYRAGRAVRGPMVLDGQPVALEAAVGVAVADRGDETAEQLLGEAHAAASHVRRSTRDQVVVFDPDVARRASDRLVVELGLHRALAHDELVVYYQPVWAIPKPRVVGVEALVRWHDPEHGVRPPVDFIGVAEDSGLIRQVTRRVLEQACSQIVQWQHTTPDVPLQVSVNVSAVELHDPGLIADVRHAIDSSGIDPPLLCLELTETAVMTDASAALEVLDQLKNLGIRLAIDDFGTGYSSLAYLRRLPVDYLKIDRSFITEMLVSPEDEAIVATVISLAKTLGLWMVAEGVETAEHVAALRGMTCAFGQGFHWSPAVPPEEIEQMLQSAGSDRSGR